MDEAVIRRRHALLLALGEVLCPSLAGRASHRLARVVDTGALELVVSAGVAALGDSPLEESDLAWLESGLAEISAERVRHFDDELRRLADRGVWMADVSDEAYPANLRMVHDRPPFIMVRGSLEVGDDRAVAVVGTRKPSMEGRETAYLIAEQLAERHVTVVSGLAAGIDTAAHSGALSAGGRTIAVFGTGIEVLYPAANRALARAVVRSGACVSQFWPAYRGARWSFPARNLVTSGISLGTIVVEAGETSGARLQAEAASRHGKRVLLFSTLVGRERWAAGMASSGVAVVVHSVEEVMEAIEPDLLTGVSVAV
jgi:DNA processing protein